VYSEEIQCSLQRQRSRFGSKVSAVVAIEAVAGVFVDERRVAAATFGNLRDEFGRYQRVLRRY
jgi:hypothetical protein